MHDPGAAIVEVDEQILPMAAEVFDIPPLEFPLERVRRVRDSEPFGASVDAHAHDLPPYQQRFEVSPDRLDFW